MSTNEADDQVQGPDFQPDAGSEIAATHTPEPGVSAAFGAAAASELAADSTAETLHEAAEEAVRKAGPRRPYRVFGRDSHHVDALHERITALEENERKIREFSAERMEIFSDIIDLAEHEGNRELLPKEPGLRSDDAPPTGLEAGAVAVLQASGGSPRDSLAFRAVRAEVAAATGVTEQTVEKHFFQAVGLVRQYPETFSMLERGDISLQHANAIHDVGLDIGIAGLEDTPEIAATRRAYEEDALVQAVRMSPNRFRHYLKSLVEQYALESLDVRNARAMRERDVYVVAKDDGMAEVRIIAPAPVAHAVKDRASQMAGRVRAAERFAEVEAEEAALVAAETAGPVALSSQEQRKQERRRIGEIRADICIDLLTNGTGETATGQVGVGITGNVQVVTHDSLLKQKFVSLDKHVKHAERVKTAAGSTTTKVKPLREPFPDLHGYGPIPKTATLEIMVTDQKTGAAVPWNFLTTHPETGDLLKIDRYAPSAAMRRFVQARDQHCKFPGCRTAAYRCGIDHTIDAALGGETAIWNISALCRGHHVLKHHTGWKIKQHAHGICEWTSPTGRSYVEEPISRVMFRATAANPADGLTDKGPGSGTPGDRTAKIRAEGTAPPESEPPGDAYDDTSHPF